MDIDLNCDLGEGCPYDAELMPLITSANIACGGHAGDAATAHAALALAARHDVRAGAHPGFPDREHFGRRELARSEQQVFEDCVFQIGALAGLARAVGCELRYVKPHGALYNMACRDDAYARPVVEAAALFGLAVMGLPASRLEALSAGRCPFVAEGFADRRYQSDGSLVPRSRPDAFVDDPAEAVRQAEWLLRVRGVRTLCVHGDNPQALAFVRQLRAALTRQGIPHPTLRMTLHVLQPGLYTLPVDYGRPRSRSLGVPLGGAADRRALALGNALVGNAPDAAALEISLAGPVLRAECELGCVLFGAPFELTSNRQRLRAEKTFTLSLGEEVHVGGTRAGARAYFCVRGGFDFPRVLGSRSALEPVRAGDALPCQPGRIHARFLGPASDEGERPRLLRVVDGPQAAWFECGRFYTQEFVVTRASNRMGIRLESEPLELPARELVSEPVCPGAVQVTRDGRCIILGVDGQTIGGYPKIAQVISADLDRLGQLRPDERVRFVRVGLAEAEQLYRRQQAEMKEWLTRLRVSLG